MFSIKSDIKRVATGLAGAFVLTTTFVGAAVLPARAIETTPTTYAAGNQNVAHVDA